MATFSYKIQQSGATQTGTFEAVSLQEASTILRRDKAVILQLRAVSAANGTSQGRKAAASSDSPGETPTWHTSLGGS